MEVNVEAIQELIDEKFRGNVSWFADEIQVDKAYIASILNYKRDAKSNKFIVGIINYCKKNNLNYENYIIFLKERLKKINQKEKYNMKKLKNATTTQKGRRKNYGKKSRSNN